MTSGVGFGGVSFIQKLWGDVSPQLQNLMEMDFKNMTLKDYVTLIGFAYTACKTMYALYGMLKIVKVHGVSKVMRSNLKKKFGKWAVVTGCCRGIGEAYVHELAKSGMNIVLLTGNEERLHILSEEVEEKYKIQTEQICVSLFQQEDRYSAIQEKLEGKEIGILMNNIAIYPDVPTDFDELDSMDIFQLMTGNMIPTTMMTHMLLPQMLERGRGAIIIVVEGGPGEVVPQMTLYGSTKAYLTHFAESLYQQYKDEGITIQCLTPYKVATEDGTVHESMLVPSSSAYARSALSTLGYSHRTTGCTLHTIQSWVDRAFPPWLRAWLLATFNDVIQQKASEKLGVDLQNIEAPKYEDGSRPFSGSLSAFLEGIHIDG